MIELNTRHLALLCAGQFIAHFDYDDLVDNRYCSEYETNICSTLLLLHCRARFDKKGEQISDFDFDVESCDRRTQLHIIGSMQQARSKARQWINAYLKNYRTYCPLEI